MCECVCVCVFVCVCVCVCCVTDLTREKNNVPDKSIYLLLQVIINRLKLVFNRSRSNCALGISVEEDWWVSYNIRT